MFTSLDTNGYNLFDSLNPIQTSMLPSFTTHHTQNPNCHHSFPFSEDFLNNCGDDSSLETHFLLQSQGVVGSYDGKNLDVSPRKVKKGNQKNKKEKCINGSKVKQIVPRRRTGKKDRHSKIFTAQGPRDRRMRLSLQIARKFFDLQDMLGFDKASKTIEWLFSKSKSSIKQLKESVAAANGDGGGEDYENIQADEKDNDENLEVIVSKRRTNTKESSCKMKESRDKARKRARERTITKMKMRSFSETKQETKRIKITSKGSDAKVEVENQEQEWSKVNMEENQIDSVSIIEKFLGLYTHSSSSSIFGDSEEFYTRDAISTAVVREGNTTSSTSTDKERTPISSFSLYDYLCY